MLLLSLLLAFAEPALQTPVTEIPLAPANCAGKDWRAGDLKGLFDKKPQWDVSGWRIEGDNALTLNGKGIDMLPSQTISVTAAATIEEAPDWCSLLGCMQDNGSYERGFFLGSRGGYPCFAVSTGKDLVYAKSTQPLPLGQPVVLLGTFDGRQIRLYVNGVEAASAELNGSIAYDADTPLIAGAFRDKDENFPVKGTIHALAISQTALDATSAAQQVKGVLAKLPQAPAFVIPPSLSYLSADRARLEYSCPGMKNPVLRLRTPGQAAQTLSLAADGSFPIPVGRPFSLELSAVSPDDRPLIAGPYNFDAAAAMQRAVLPVAKSAPLLPINTGYIIIQGLSQADDILAQIASGQANAVVFVADAAQAAALRHELLKQAALGARVSVLATADASRMSELFADGLILRGPRQNAELLKLVKPGGLVSLDTGHPGSDFVAAGKLWRRKPLPGAAPWTHQYGSLANTASNGENLGGIDSTAALKTQWLGLPGGNFGLDRNPRMPAPLAAGGRLFHQGQERMVALDAANGSILWSRELPGLHRFNLPRDCSNWASDGQRLVVAHKQSLLSLDPASGRILTSQGLPSSAAASDLWGFVGLYQDLVLGTAVDKDAPYHNWWGGAQWYDSIKDESMGQVAGKVLFASRGGKILWSRPGLVLHPSICVQGGKLYALTVANSAKEPPPHRLLLKNVWSRLQILCLDPLTGKELFCHNIPATPQFDLSSYLLVGPKSELVLVGSSSVDRKHHLQRLNPRNGKPLWTQAHPWPEAAHSGHILHPVLHQNKVFLEPMAYDLNNGKVAWQGIGKREGCHNYLAAGKCLIFRGTDRQISLFSLDKKETSTFTRLRPSCWLSMIPAEGFLLCPEGGGGCSCGGWLETSVGFSPWEK